MKAKQMKKLFLAIIAVGALALPTQAAYYLTGDFEGSITAAIVNEDDLVRLPGRTYGVRYGAIQERYVVFFVVKRDNHRKSYGTHIN